jgi:hypothetical protein
MIGRQLARWIVPLALAWPLLGQLPPALARPAAQDPPNLVIDGQTVTLAGDHRYDQVVLRQGAVLQVEPYAGANGGGHLKLAARRIEVDATSRITADAAGWRGVVEGKGEGPGGGEGGITSLALAALGRRPYHAEASGGGGAYGGRGGDGILDSVRGGWKGGRPYGEARGQAVELGSAGGAPPPSHHERQSIPGGNGGGAIELWADGVFLAGEVSAVGQTGPAAEYDAGGGGAGGGILIVADRLELTGRVLAAGGPGGQAVDVGGSGSGGRVKIYYRRGGIDPTRIDVGPGHGPCPSPEKASPWGCDGTLVLERQPAPVYLPMTLRAGCLGPGRRAIVLVMDVSTSMARPTRSGRPALAVAAEAADAFLAQLGAADRAALVVFHHQAEVRQQLTGDMDVARTALQGLATAEGSRLDLGLAAGQAVLAAATPAERRVLISVTDGMLSQVDATTVRQVASQVRAAGVTVYALAFGSGTNVELLQAVAGDPGRVLVTPDADELSALYARLRAQEACP